MASPVAPTPWGTLLASLRADAGISQAALGRRAGLDPSYINHIEKGRIHSTTGKPTRPSREVIARVADVLRLDESARQELYVACGHAVAANYPLGQFEWRLLRAARDPGRRAVLDALLDSWRTDESDGRPLPHAVAGGVGE